MFRRFPLLALAGLLLLAACAAPPSNSETPAPTAAIPATAPVTVAPAAQPTAAQVPATVAPTVAPAASATIAAPAAAASGTPAAGSASTNNAAAPAAAMKLVIDPNASEARFQAREVLAGHNLPNDAIGKTKAVSGAIVIQLDGKLVADQSSITVDISTLTSDVAMRDGFIKRSTLQTDQYPTVTFAPTSVEGLPSPLPTSGDVTFTIKGDLTVKGKPYPTTWQVTGHIDGNQMTGTASTSFKFEDVGLTMPHVQRVLSIEDNLKLVLDYTISKAG
jgi:polyisoprenoid-binding protein YceI